MITYIIKALPEDDRDDSVELLSTFSRKDAIAHAKQYQQEFYEDTVIVEKYNDYEYLEVVFNARVS